MEKIELKQQLKNLLKENEEFFLESINEVFFEEWSKDEEENFLMTNIFSSNLIIYLRDKINKELGEKYIKSSSKLSTLLNTFINDKVIEKGTNDDKRKEFEKDPLILEGVREIIKICEEEHGENW